MYFHARIKSDTFRYNMYKYRCNSGGIVFLQVTCGKSYLKWTKIFTWKSMSPGVQFFQKEIKPLLVFNFLVTNITKKNVEGEDNLFVRLLSLEISLES